MHERERERLIQPGSYNAKWTRIQHQIRWGYENMRTTHQNIFIINKKKGQYDALYFIWIHPKKRTSQIQANQSMKRHCTLVTMRWQPYGQKQTLVAL